MGWQEIILVDDGNEDPTVGSELASLEKVRLIRQVVRGSAHGHKE